MIKLLIDNWLLQDVAGILTRGLSPGDTSEIVVDISRDSFFDVDVPHAGIQIQALLNFLVDIVVRDRLILDRSFAFSWQQFDNPIFKGLETQRIIEIKDFDLASSIYKVVMPSAVKDICVTKDLIEVQKANEKLWKREKRPENPFMSQVIWGTAGNLARSHMISSPYSPHPTREFFLGQTLFKPERPDAIQGTLEWIDAERASLFQEVRKGTTFRAAQFILSPIVVEIIESCKTVDELIPVAIQMRDKYKGFREHMAKYQAAIDEENPKGINKYKKLFDSVHSFISPDNSLDKYGQINLSTGISWSKGIPIDAILSNIGIRATLKKMIFQKKGMSSLGSLLTMFDEGKTILGGEVLKYLQK